ncbi:TetR family transcriptional regulator, partial [Xanthomonas citri pv. citri]
MAALVDIMNKALEVINQLNATDQTAIDKLKALTQWAMRLKLAQKMPNLPSENSQLRELLIANDDYTNNLVMLSDSIGEWIEQAQAEGKLQSNIPGLAILYTLYARACDPVLG